jgi:hypothetical protein
MFGDTTHKDCSSSHFATFTSFISTSKALISINISLQHDIESTEFISKNKKVKVILYYYLFNCNWVVARWQ